MTLGARRAAVPRGYWAEYWILLATAVSLSVLFWYPAVMRQGTEGMLHPHGFCYLWKPSLVWSHVLSDLLIGAAYVAISATLGFLVYRVRHLLPFHWMFLAFGLFILTCGATHFMEVWTLWFADFWASAALKIVTAVASVATALALPPLVPQVVRLLQAAALSEKRLEELERARHDQQEAEAESRAKDLFLATLSHELRTPLNVVGGWARVIAAASEADTSLRQAADAIQRNISLQTRLVEDMLDVSSILTGRLTLQRQTMDLLAAVRDTAAAMKAAALARQVRLECDFPRESIPVTADTARIQQIVNNLLTNAVKFTDPGGSVRVVIRRHANEAEIIITDTGRGIDPVFLPKMFDPFAQEDQSPTRTAGGLGLGLAIVRHLAERHGGRVIAESEGVGRGATFRVFLPLAEQEAR